MTGGLWRNGSDKVSIDIKRAVKDAENINISIGLY